MYIKKIFMAVVLSGLFSSTSASPGINHEYIFSAVQSVQVINLLANTNLNDPGMTATPITIKYYNGGSYPCWVSDLNYQSDTTVYAGSGLGCVEKITEIIISPLAVANKLKTYKGSVVITVDPTKFAHQISVIQDQAPVFDTQSGLVVKSGIIKFNIQSMYH